MTLCPYFGSCGACTAQHIPYEIQLENKKAVLAHVLEKSGIATVTTTGITAGITASTPGSLDIAVFHKEPYHYRNRMDFVFHTHGLGLRKKGRYNTIIPIEACPISNNKLNTLLAEVQQWFHANGDRLEPFDLQKQTGTLKYCVIRAPEFTDDSSLSFVLNADSFSIKEHLELIRAFAQATTAAATTITA
ncbi:hypothetical protein COY95_03355, partial [Candidatus Woesearchaeota archaeon CG_4_10_14_0_8_um_filter_47_5]